MIDDNESTFETGDKAASTDGKEPASALDRDNLFRRLRRWFLVDKRHSEDWRRSAENEFDFVAGRQWSAEDMAKLREQMRPVIAFNRIAPVISAVSGTEVTNRQEVRYLPRQPGDAMADEMLTNAAKWFRDECNGEDNESDAFWDTLVCGMGWCLSDDAMVRLPNTHFATTRLYSGSVIEVHLENGQKLTGTPNHPVLTDMGWKPLHALSEGDNLVNSAFLEWVNGFPVEQFDKVETRLKDKVDAFRAGREALWCVTAPNDFYSDGAGSEVHVVYADRLLSDKLRNAASLKARLKQQFVWRRLLSDLRSRLLRCSVSFHAIFAAERQFALNIAHAPCAQGSAGNNAAKLMSSAPETFANGFACEAKTLGNFVGGKFFGEVKSLDFLKRHFGLSAAVSGGKNDASPKETGVDAAPRYSEFIADFRDWKPILEMELQKLRSGDGIAPQFVTRIARRVVKSVNDFPVHDVGTSLGLFVAGNIITSNTETRMDFERDRDGAPLIDRVDPLEMFWDAAAKQRNIEDARRIWRVKKVPIDEAKALVGELDADDDDMDAKWANFDDRGNKDETRQEARFYRPTKDGGLDEGDDLITLVECQWWERETIHAVATETGVEFLTQEQMDKALERYEELGQEPPKSAKQTRRKYFRAWLGEKVLAEPEEAPFGEHFSYQAITGYRDRNKGTFYGLVRSMLDPQQWANKWLSQTMHMMNTAAKGGALVEKGAFDDEREAEKSWSRPDAFVYMRQGALSNPNAPKIQPKPQVPTPPESLNLMEFAIQSLRDVGGVNLELLGQKSTEQPGVLEMQRKKQAMAVLAVLFDSLRRYRKNQGRLLLWLIQNFVSDGRLIRITGEMGATQYIPFIRQPEWAEYDVIVDDAPSSPQQKEIAWGTMMQMLPAFKNAMSPELLAMVMKYSPMPASAVQELQQALAKAQAQAAQQAAQMAPMQQAGAAAQVQETQTKAALNQAKAMRESAAAQREQIPQILVSPMSQVN